MSARQIPWARVFVEGVVIVGSILLAFGMRGLGMSRTLLVVVTGSLLLLPACGGDDPTGPSEPFCVNHPGSATVTFADANLEGAIRTALGLGPQDDLTCDVVSGLTTLGAGGLGIMSLEGLQNLTSLGSLNLTDNSIIDITALSGLTSLTLLDLEGNAVSVISALSGLTSLTLLFLQDNAITDVGALRDLTGLSGLNLSGNTGLTDIQPLLDNTGLGAGDTVLLGSTSVSCVDVAALEAKGVTVASDCP